MKLTRYRRPSVNTILGVTREKRRIKRELGISEVQAWTRPGRVKQRAKYQMGYYTPVMRVTRQTSQGKFPSILGLFTKRK